MTDWWLLKKTDFALLHSLNILVILLSLVNTRVWAYLFRDPNRVFRFRRGCEGYRQAVYILSFFTITP